MPDKETRARYTENTVVWVIVIAILALTVFTLISDVRFIAAAASAISASAHADDPVDVTKSSVPTPDEAVAKSRTSGIPDCTPSDITITLNPDAANVASGAMATFHATITHVSQQTCFIDAGEDSLALIITDAGGVTVYDSSVCDVKSNPLLLGENDVETYEIDWATVSQTTECASTTSTVAHVPAGTYSAHLQGTENAEFTSPTTDITVTVAPTPTATSSESTEPQEQTADDNDGSGTTGADDTAGASETSGDAGDNDGNVTDINQNEEDTTP